MGATLTDMDTLDILIDGVTTWERGKLRLILRPILKPILRLIPTMDTMAMDPTEDFLTPGPMVMVGTMVSTFWAKERQRLHPRLMPGMVVTMEDTMEDITDTPIGTMDMATVTGVRRVIVFRKNLKREPVHHFSSRF